MLSRTPDLPQMHYNTLSLKYLYLENTLFAQTADFPNKKIKSFGDAEGLLVFWRLGWVWAGVDIARDTYF